MTFSSQLRNRWNDRSLLLLVAAICLVVEFCVSVVMVLKVPYTELDWKAYMQEVEGYLEGELDYTKLRGDTGPLVYPAGFVRLFVGFYKVTDRGSNIRLAQWIFVGLYLFSVAVMMALYSRSSKTTPFHLVLLCVSHRMHSIFMLRLFNDPIAMLFAHVGILFLTFHKHFFAVVFIALGMSIKMNVMLFLPALLYIIARERGLLRGILYTLVIPLIQALLAFDFLLAYPLQYLSKAFEFSRQFFYIWSVNWQFIPEPIFLSKSFSSVLLGAQLLLLLLFLFFRWSTDLLQPFRVLVHSNGSEVLSSDTIISMMFECNLLGIVVSRSAHYQFYSWYYFTLPWMLLRNLPTFLALVSLFLIEVCWNVFYATPESSFMLFVLHLFVVLMIFVRGRLDKRASEHCKED